MRIYLILVAILGVAVAILLIPSLLVVAAILTFGASMILTDILLNLFAVLVLLIPAVWIMQRSFLKGLLAAAVLLCGAILLPGVYRTYSEKYQPLLQPPFLADLTQPPKSVQLWVKSLSRTRDAQPCSEMCMKLFQNPNLEWIRLMTDGDRSRLYVRDSEGEMIVQKDHDLVADLIIKDYTAFRPEFSESFLNVWIRSGGPNGYEVEDTRSRQVIARNFSASMDGVSDYSFLYIHMGVISSGKPKVRISRDEHASVSADPNRSLEGDLAKWGLFTTEKPETSTTIDSPPAIPENAMQRGRVTKGK